MLGQLLSARYTDQTITVFNRGLPGEQASRALSRFIATFVADAPDVVVLMEGYNDVRQTSQRRRRYRERHSAGSPNWPARPAGAARASSSARWPRADPGGIEIQRSALEFINDRLRQVARSEGAVLVDVFSALLPEVNANVSIDGLHLTPLGYRRVAETVFAAIRADLEIR